MSHRSTVLFSPRLRGWRRHQASVRRHVRKQQIVGESRQQSYVPLSSSSLSIMSRWCSESLFEFVAAARLAPGHAAPGNASKFFSHVLLRECPPASMSCSQARRHSTGPHSTRAPKRALWEDTDEAASDLDNGRSRFCPRYEPCLVPAHGTCYQCADAGASLHAAVTCFPESSEWSSVFPFFFWSKHFITENFQKKNLGALPLFHLFSMQNATGLCVSATAVNSDFFNDVEDLKEQVTTLTS